MITWLKSWYNIITDVWRDFGSEAIIYYMDEKSGIVVVWSTDRYLHVLVQVHAKVCSKHAHTLAEDLSNNKVCSDWIHLHSHAW